MDGARNGEEEEEEEEGEEPEGYTEAVKEVLAPTPASPIILGGGDHHPDHSFRQRRVFFQALEDRVRIKAGKTSQYIHVAGTKGKGTVCELMRVALINENKRVGTFTSPHLHTIRERICVDHKRVSKAQFMRLWEFVRPLLEEQGDWVLFFDRLLAMALVHFIEQQVDYAILEVGVGGRFDPTNFVERPAVVVITSISFDHMDLLGDTLEKIAWQKAGVMKPGVPVVVSGHHHGDDDDDSEGVLQVFRQEASQTPGCELHVVATKGKGPLLSPRRCAASTSTLPAVRQENIRLAEVALGILGLSTPNFEGSSSRGRFEVVELLSPSGGALTVSQPVVLDVAHNKESMTRLLAEVATRFPGYRVWCLFGAGLDKDCRGMFEVILGSEAVTRLMLVQSTHAKASPVQALQQLLLPFLPKAGRPPSGCLVVVTDKPHPDTAFTWALKERERELAIAPEDKVVVVACGSFYVVAAVRAILAAKQPLSFRTEDPVWEQGL